FLRMPDNTTRRGAAFHRRSLERARREATLVLTPSEFTRRELLCEGFAPDNVVVTPLGVHPVQPRAGDEIDAVLGQLHVSGPFLLTVGTVEPRKDLPTIVAAYERLRRSHPELELLVVGPPGWGDVDGIDRRGVRIMGRLPWIAVDALYR